MRIATLAWILAVSFAPLSACGGGQSAAPFGPELVEGNYRFIMLESTTDDAHAMTGVFAPTGSEFQPSDYFSASEGIGGPVDAMFPVPYDVLADRTFTLVDSQIRGRITTDGMLATAVSTTPDTDSLLMILVRQQQTPLLASLAGSWKMISYGRSANPAYTTNASVGDATIDVNGLLTYSDITTNLDGHLDPLPHVLTPSQFVLLANGTLALQSVAGLSQRGGVSQDGNVILLAGNMISGVPMIRVLVRKGTATPSDFVGNYWSAAVEFVSRSPRAQWGPLNRAPSSDAIAETSFLILNAVVGPTTLTYSAGSLPDGELTMVLPAGPIQEIYRGMVAAGGAYAFYGGAISPNSGRTFTVLVR